MCDILVFNNPGARYTDIDTGVNLGQSAVFMRGYNVSSKNETFFFSEGTDYEIDQWHGETCSNATEHKYVRSYYSSSLA